MTSTQFLATSFLATGLIAGAVITDQVRYESFPHGEVGSVFFHQNFIEEMRTEPLDLTSQDLIFSYVFSQLPETVRVYPTENYYYFSFYNGAQWIWGNIRLDVLDRDQGLISFAYFGSHNRPETPQDLDYSGSYKQFSSADGVILTKLEPLVYQLTYHNETVTFRLHDVPQSLPEGLPLDEHERFMARTFDESGFQLALLFDGDQKQFRFLLDETAVVPDVLTEIEPRLFVGRLSGFAFWADDLGRKVLIGVDRNNTRRNNYYDGPFDQLADNFVTDSTLHDAMEAAYPYVRGRINNWGTFVDSTGKRLDTRLALTPYASYTTQSELHSFVSLCKEKGTSREQLACLTRDYKQTTPESSASGSSRE